MRRLGAAPLTALAFSALLATGLTLAGAAWLAVAARPAIAHAAIEETHPEDGTILDAPPEELRLSFTEPPDLSLTTVEVVDRSGAPAPAGPIVAGPGREIRVPVEDLADGVYTVTWRTVSTTDGHVTAGAFTFGVGVSAGEVVPAGAGGETETSPPTTAMVAGRWALYVGLAVLLGAALSGLLAFGPAAIARPWVLGLAWTVAAAGVVVTALAERAAVGVPLGALLSSDTGGAYVRLAVAVGVAGVATLAAALRPVRATMFLLAACAGAAMLARAAAGHAGGSLVDVLAQWLHMIAVGVWIGGLVWLVLSLRRGIETAQVRRYSNLAAGGLALLFVSGSLRASNELGLTWWLDPFENGYSTSLVVKLAIVTPLVVLGALNRFRNVRRLEELGPRPLRRTVGGELALAAAVFATTGILTGLPPQEEEVAHAAEPLVVTGSDFATTTTVLLRISPGVVGPNEFVAEVADYDTGEALDARRVTLEFDLPERAEVGSELPLAPVVETWRASGTNLSLDGTWDVTVLVELADGSIEVPLVVVPHPPEQHLEVSRVPGQPDLYTFTLDGGVQIQAYVDPGVPGRTNQVHLTAFDAGGMELPLGSGIVTVLPPEGDPFAPELLRLGPGHFAANLELVPGSWGFDLSAETEDGRLLRASFEQTFEA